MYTGLVILFVTTGHLEGQMSSVICFLEGYIYRLSILLIFDQQILVHIWLKFLVTPETKPVTLNNFETFERFLMLDITDHDTGPPKLLTTGGYSDSQLI